MKKVCANLRVYTIKITNCEKQELLPLTKNREIQTYANKNSMKSLMKNKTIVRFGITAITQGTTHSIYNLRY